MSTKTKALPAGWSAFLDEVQARLDRAIAATNARIEQLPQVNAVSAAQGRRQEIAQWSDRLSRLSAYLESAEQVVQSVDELLHREESNIRQQLTTSQSLRQKAS